MSTDRDPAPLPLDVETLAARLRAEGKRVFAGSFTDAGGAAAFLGVERETLRKWRATGRGPRFLRPHRVILYPLDDLIAYAYSESAPSGMERD